jgi:hypothetical protein
MELKREQLIQKFRKEAKLQGLPFRVDMARGKGGHCMVWVGDRATVIPSGEISPAFEKIIRRQLGL